MKIRRYLAEAVGTFILVGVGSLSIVAAAKGTLPGLLVAPFGFGIGLLVAIYAVGHVSGGHFNPAVTLAAFIDRRIDLIDAIVYGVAQVLGAIAASLMIWVVSDAASVKGTRNVPGAGVAEPVAFFLEIVLTAIFLLVILTVSRRDPDRAPFAIALTLLAIHFAAIPISGASVNPARALGPAIVSGDYSSLWIYLSAPFLGAIIGWGLYRILWLEDEEA